MSDFALDDLDRARLDWPEPVLIDVISEHYAGIPNAGERMIVARLHTRFLHELVEGEPRSSAFLRIELIACCAARGIAMRAIEAADEGAFRELTRIVEARFRNSSRMRQHFMKRLDGAVERLPERSDAPRQKVAPIRVLPTGRDTWVRPPVRIGRQVAVNG